MRTAGVTSLALAFAALAACSKKHAGPPSCHDRVVALHDHLAAPRTHAAIRAGASPALAKLLDDIDADHGPRSLAYGTRIEQLVGSCGPARAAIGDILVGSDATLKSAGLRDQLPPALEQCQCVVSPEDTGGLLEGLEVDVWGMQPH